MGRSYISVRMGVNEVAARWKRASRQLREDDAGLVEDLVRSAKQFSSEAFYAFDDPLEAALFSVAISLVRDRERAVIPEPVRTARTPGEHGAREPDEKSPDGPGTGICGVWHVDY
jgi:hypothetical protein